MQEAKSVQPSPLGSACCWHRIRASQKETLAHEGAFSLTTMRFAFVIRLGNDTRPADGLFEGWIEEVDSGIELRFRSAEQLLKFLGQRFENAVDLQGNIRSCGVAQDQPEKKRGRKGKKAP